MKKLVLYLDGSPNDRDSLGYAVQFHKKLGGRLNVSYMRVPEAKVGSVARAIDVEQRALASARQVYDELCNEVESTDWLQSDLEFENLIRYQGRLHDLTILERVSHEEGPAAFALNTALFETGRPVLVSSPPPPSVAGGRVALVWSPSVQSARVVASAIPILKHAREVCILTNSENEAAKPEELAAYLSCHGIASEAKAFNGAQLTARGRGRAILATVREIAADLLVMGAYGENRLRSILGLGRATQKIVCDSPVPVFLQS